MKNISAILLFIIIVINYSCNNPRSTEEIHGKINQNQKILSEAIKSEILLTKLDELIDFRDSITFSRTRPDTTQSFWIYFIRHEKKCFVTLMAQFSYYDSKGMDGYFRHRERYVSVYNSEIDCAREFINPEHLKTRKIEKLIDYNRPIDDKLPPIPPHNPYGREYLIITKDSLLLNAEGIHLLLPDILK
jgi:hypothetical protein